MKCMRGKAAALLANLDDSTDSDEDNSQIYSNILKTTKKELANTKNEFAISDKKIMKDVNAKTIKSDEINSSGISSSDDSSSSVNSVKVAHKNRKKNKISRISSSPSSSSSPSPPPPPPSTVASKPKNTRKSMTLIDKQLKELDKIKTKTSSSKNLDSSINVNDQSNIEDDNMITVRISTKTGIQRFEIDRNSQFKIIYEKLSFTENTRIENLLLTYKENKINYSDTPAGLDLQIYDIIDCGIVKGKILERIQIIENEGDIENVLPDMIIVMLQTREGRKSRVKFLIKKDEPLKNMLRMYCQKLVLEDFENYILEFDGDVVKSTDTSNSLDLDGDEIFDVKKSSKPTMQFINENKKNYEFDDDILIV